MDEFTQLLAAHAGAAHGGGGSGGGGGNGHGGSGHGGNGGTRKRRRGGAGRNKGDRGRSGGHDANPRARSRARTEADVRGPWARAWEARRLERVRGRFLAIVAAGDGSLHDDPEHPWHGSPDFDLCVVYFGASEEKAARYKAHAQYFVRQQGPKWQLVRRALREVDWRKYEYIWLPDDDLRMDARDVGRMFRLASEHELLLAQPALYDQNVQRQYREVLVYREDLLLHYSNFVEIMCPLLRVDVLEFVRHTLDTAECKSGWGLDLLWPTMLHFRNIAVLDATPVLHTRPQNAFSVDSSFYRTYRIDPQRECHDLMRRFGFRDFRKRRLLDVPLPAARHDAALSPTTPPAPPSPAHQQQQQEQQPPAKLEAPTAQDQLAPTAPAAQPAPAPGGEA